MASKNQNKTQNQNSDIRSEASHYRRDPTFFLSMLVLGWSVTMRWRDDVVW